MRSPCCLCVCLSVYPPQYQFLNEYTRNNRRNIGLVIFCDVRGISKESRLLVDDYHLLGDDTVWLL
jgi:hypothetical protein